jgi:hypothetical protein
MLMFGIGYNLRKNLTLIGLYFAWNFLENKCVNYYLHMLWPAVDAFTPPFVLLWCLTVIIAKCEMVQGKYTVEVFIPIYHVDECNACLG